MGISYGAPSSKAPLNTGRADYFGSVPNLAARLMAVAQPGQVTICMFVLLPGGCVCGPNQSLGSLLASFGTSRWQPLSPPFAPLRPLHVPDFV